MTAAGQGLELPELVDPRAGVRLRSWESDDVNALVAAWATPDIGGRARAGQERIPEAAARWIAGAPTRAATGLAVDLVIGPLEGPEVWGEVGLVRRRLTTDDTTTARTVWEVGWWLLPARRGRGRARAAVALLGRWAGPALGIGAWVARIEPGALASQRVAAAVGLERRGPFDADHDLWAGPVPDEPGGAGAMQV